MIDSKDKASEQLSVLVLSSTFPRWCHDTVPAFVLYLCQQLSKEFSIDVLAPHHQGAKACEGSSWGRIYRYIYAPSMFEKLAYGNGIMTNIKSNRWLLLLLPFFLMSQILTAVYLLYRNRYEVIHAHWVIPQGLIAVLLKALPFVYVKVLITLHGSDLFELQGGVINALRLWVLSRADRISVVSHAMKSTLESAGIDAGKLDVLPMGVDTKKTFTPLRQHQHRNGLLFVGRLVEQKGLTYLIDAMSEVIIQSPSMTLTVVGDGAERLNLERQVRDLGLNENIVFLGAVPNERLPKLYQQAKIMVMPSLGDEGLGLVAVEAAACGCVVVASNLPAIKDIVQDQKTGLLVDEKSSEQLAKAIISYLNNPERAEEHANKARAYIEGVFDWEVVGERYRSLIAGL